MDIVGGHDMGRGDMVGISTGTFHLKITLGIDFYWSC